MRYLRPGRFWQRLCLLASLTLASPFAHAEPKKILLIYAGEGGHSTAAKSITALINEQWPDATVVKHDFADDTSGVSKFFITKAYDFFSRNASAVNTALLKGMWLQEANIPRFVSQRQMTKLISTKPLYDYINKEKPDMVISTYFPAAEIMARLRHDGKLTNIPMAWTQLDTVDEIYYEQIGDELDMSFLPTKDMADKWSKEIGTDKVKHLGMPIMPKMTVPVDRSLREVNALKWGLNPKAPTVLLMGGSAGALSYRNIIEALQKPSGSTEPVQIIAITGKNTRAKEDLDRWMKSSDFPTKRIKTLTTTGFIPLDQVRELQSTADVIISKPGGLSSYELLASGIPSVLTESIGIQEVQNAEFLQSHGAAVFEPDARKAAAAAIKLIEDKPRVEEMAASQARLSKEIFNLGAVMDWLKNPKIMPFPKEPVLARIRRMQARGRSGATSACENEFNQI